MIYNPFGSADKTQIVFEDLPEDSEYYEAVRLMFEEGLMLPAGETVFDVEGDALVGDMAYALYALGFGEAPPSVDAARAALGEYGIMVSNAANDAALSGNGAEDALASFSPAVGLPYQRSGSATDEALSRGEFAEVFVQYLLDEGIIEDDGE